MKLTLTALVAALALAGCSRSLAIEKELGSAVSELDNAIWKDGLKPIVPGVDVPKELK
jgi:outer membrane murein-binding lipoprotein Lpp